MEICEIAKYLLSATLIFSAGWQMFASTRKICSIYSEAKSKNIVVAPWRGEEGWKGTSVTRHTFYMTIKTAVSTVIPTHQFNVT